MYTIKGSVSHLRTLQWHCLNLVISKSCSQPQVRIDFEAKRSGVLQLIISANIVNQGDREPIPDLCNTRWDEGHNAYRHFYQAYVFIVEARKND